MPFLPPNQQRQSTVGKVGQSEVTVKVSPEEEKTERLQWEGFAEKEGFKSGMKERVGDKYLSFECKFGLVFGGSNSSLHPLRLVRN